MSSNLIAIPGRDLRGWFFAMACGLISGCFIGVGMSGAYAHAIWPISAGIVMGLVSALVARSCPVLVALGSGVVVAITSVAIVALDQYRSGHWPITDEFTIVHYGTAGMAVVRLTVILLVLVCVPCVVSAAVAALAKRRGIQ